MTAPTDLSNDQRIAVRTAVGRMRRHVWNPQDIEDALQDAAEGVLRAKMDAEKTAGECGAYLIRRALGAALDARRRLNGRWRHESERPIHIDNEGGVFDLLAAPDNPSFSYAVRQAMEAVERLPSPLPLIAKRLAEGCPPGEIADELGVSPSRVSQHRLEITTYLKDHFV